MDELTYAGIVANEINRKNQKASVEELRAAFDQAMSWLQTVAAKHDFSPEGFREFNTAVNTAKIARDNLYFAEVAANRGNHA